MINVKHAIISLTEQTVRELLSAVEKAKKDKGIKDGSIYVYSEFSAIDFKIDVGDNIESLGYHLRED